ncbi:MAG: transposase [Planctomycetes bacterium RIFCSPHIGHO2_12_42_15]|nr:MAG: transposase [Planctomycetes bacterium RIFCSPHIGHO2_12_42_15]
MAYIMGNRKQKTFFPPTIEDYVGKEDPVRVYDAFIDSIDLQEMGIIIEPFQAGAPAFEPKAMLKLIVYGYSYGIRSSRKLERACYHNLSFMWLVSGIQPDYRTIAKFRSDNKEAIKQILRQNVKLCIKLGLIEGNTLFVDGSKFRANASINNTWDEERCKKRLEIAEKNIERIMEEAEQIDKEEDSAGTLVKLNEELQDQKKMRAKVQEIVKTLKETGKEKINTTDKDSVNGKSRQGSHAVMNCEVTTDEKYGLIVNGEAVSQNNDLNQLSPQVEQSTETLGKPPAQVVSDSGYFSLKDIERVPEQVKVIMPSRRQAQKENKKTEVDPFSIEEFSYDKERDVYICPEGKILENKGIAFGSQEKISYKARGKECMGCKYFGICTTSKNGRWVVRMVKQEEQKRRLEEIYHEEASQKLYKLRKEKAELPFGHMKRNLVAGQFMLRGREKVNAELSILSTCFNIARMMTIIGIPMLIAKLNSM